MIYHPWGSPQEEKRMIEREIGRLVSQGIRPERILILSPNRLENSCLAGCKTVGSWPLAVFGEVSQSPQDQPANAVRFATIRSFKGLESDIVFLIGLKAGKRTCTDADLYVGASLPGSCCRCFTIKTWFLRHWLPEPAKSSVNLIPERSLQCWEPFCS